MFDAPQGVAAIGDAQSSQVGQGAAHRINDQLKQGCTMSKLGEHAISMAIR